MTAPVDDPATENWTELVPHKPGRLILSPMGFPRHLVWLERKNGLPQIMIRDRKTGERTFDRLCRGSLFARAVGRRRIRHRRHPLLLFLDDDAEPALRLQHAHARAHAPEDAGSALRPQSGRLRDAPCHGAVMGRRDSCRSRCSIPRHAARRLGALPALRLRRLWHHHSGVASTPTACRSPTAASSMPSPISAAARTRASHWYEDGKMEKKTNTFNDFIAAADHLVAEGFTSHDRSSPRAVRPAAC